MSNFQELRNANTARDKEWDKHGVLTPAYHALELGGEAGEALNVVKKLEREALGIAGSRDDLEHLAEELADVVICVDKVAMKYGIKLWPAIVEKFNRTSINQGFSTFLDEENT
ncbi:MAG: nucleotide pyrophosphohydrolase [Alphaproteobacteria bacterium]|nr:nucleotide pyrophosphohydrolase [Alphaproteobacteria bacterium]